jgi:hypothetical protein
VTERAAEASRRYWIWAGAGVLAASTLYLNGITVWSVWTARSEVPWRDQWTYLEDAKSILGGAWPRLWYSYWGNRLVMTRLITLLDVRLFSGLNTPILVLSLAIQTAHAAMLAYVAWRLFARMSKAVFLAVASLAFHLCLSALQLENLMWAGQVGFVLVSASASAAFLLLALYSLQPAESGPLKKGVLLGGSMLSALVSTLSSANGALVWPLLVAQAGLVGAGRRARLLLACTGGLAIAAYFWGYKAGPPVGMGAGRAMLHPEQSIPLLGALLVGPLSVVSLRLGMVIGCAALLAALYALFEAFRPKRRPPALLSVYGAVVVFSLLSLAAVVSGRITPEFAASRVREHLLVFPSRYFSTPFFLWSCLLGISMWLVARNRRQWPQLAVLGSVTLLLSIGTACWQSGEAANWRAFYRELDVAATALLMDVQDPGNQALAQIYPEVSLRSRVRAWLEADRLSIFQERRAYLAGARFAAVAGVPREGRCQGSARAVVRVSEGSFRVTGWVVDSVAARPPRDLVFADRSGIIAGIARSGLRRPDLEGRIDRRFLDDAGWQGYLRTTSAGPIAVYGLLAGSSGSCFVTEVAELPPR